QKTSPIPPSRTPPNPASGSAAPLKSSAPSTAKSYSSANSSSSATPKSPTSSVSPSTPSAPASTAPAPPSAICSSHRPHPQQATPLSPPNQPRRRPRHKHSHRKASVYEHHSASIHARRNHVPSRRRTLRRPRPIRFRPHRNLHCVPGARDFAPQHLTQSL